MTEDSDRIAVLHEHIERFNQGVRTGDFGPMLERFDPQAELRFEGVPVGPFHGRQAIDQAYRERPPDDEVVVLEAKERPDGVVVAKYAWTRQPGTPAGEMRLTARGGSIERLVVTFGSFS
jgi:hypothetical protein